MKTIDDLKGKKMGVSTAGSLTDWLARRLAESKGWGPDGIEVVPMGDERTRLAAMQSGDLQASVTSIEESLRLQVEGRGKMLTMFGDFVPNFLTHVIFGVRRDDPRKLALVRRFLHAWFEIAAFMRDHRAATVKSIAKTMNVSEKVVNMAYDDEIKMLSFDGHFPPKALQVIRVSAEGSSASPRPSPLSRPCTIRSSCR